MPIVFARIIDTIRVRHVRITRTDLADPEEEGSEGVRHDGPGRGAHDPVWPRHDR
ncbi:hypothetical protein [Leptolyngbya sp. 7M]|uniref:hypothetical protein n=1 Tax=Leptolyngbya sp. 7M TaxID=2812896 RepID=UPI001B8CB547|nr:hypothetical protein [Leptolyngbya sp. 7M]QYO61925.1 hypothetical protein JVX88_17480 [Leptolyngbya sp. 7M]